MHLVKQLDCRSSEGGEFDPPRGRHASSLRFFFGAIFQPGGILPPHGRDRGSSPRRSTRTSRQTVGYLLSTPHGSLTLFVRRFRRRGGWPLGYGVSPGAGRLFPGAVAHLGERLTGSQEVVGSIPTGSTVVRCPGPVSGGPCLVYRRWRVQFSRAAPGRERGHRPTVKMAGSPPCRCGFDSRCPLQHSSAVVAQRSELEAAKLESGGSTPPHRSVPVLSGSGTGVRAAP